MPTITRESDKVDFVEMVARESDSQQKTIENLQFHNRGLAEALREKHNRDVELTDLLAELAHKYRHVLTPNELERINELTKPAE